LNNKLGKHVEEVKKAKEVQEAQVAKEVWWHRSKQELDYRLKPRRSVFTIE
jgi:hypothetical protein